MLTTQRLIESYKAELKAGIRPSKFSLTDKNGNTLATFPVKNSKAINRNLLHDILSEADNGDMLWIAFDTDPVIKF